MTYSLSSGDVAQQLAVTATTVNRWADAGELACLRSPGGIRRFRQSDVDEFIERMRQRQADQVAGRTGGAA